MTRGGTVVRRLYRVDGLGRGAPTRLAACLLAFLGALPAGALCGCRPSPPPPTTVAVRARSQTGAKVEGADLFAEGALIARTDREGLARLDLRGPEGETYLVRVNCPPGYLSPPEPLALTRPVGTGAGTGTGRVTEYAAVCQELRHTMVIGVRAEGGPDLPVLYLGKEVARTDRSGAAHVSVSMQAHQKIELILGTTGADNDRLHPQNPVAVFEMADHDSVELFPVTFTRDPHDGKKPPSGRHR